MQEKVFFKNKKGLKLCGIISNPSGDMAKPMMVLCHGHSTSKLSSTITGLKEKLEEKNISTFSFDISGHGESEGKFEETTVSDAMNDILSAIEYVKSLGYSKIGLFGSSFGGAASILAAEKVPELFVLTLKAPVSDYKNNILVKKGAEEIKNWKESGFFEYKDEKREGSRLAYSFFEDLNSFNEYESAKNIKTPTIVVHGDNDTEVPIEQSIKLATIIPDCKLEIIPGADHKFTNPEDFQKLVNLISEFIINKIG